MSGWEEDNVWELTDEDFEVEQKREVKYPLSSGAPITKSFTIHKESVRIQPTEVCVWCTPQHPCTSKHGSTIDLTRLQLPCPYTSPPDGPFSDFDKAVFAQ
jgi:hypothetical protein